MRRVMCVWCPLWPVQCLLSEQPAHRDCPVILFAEERHGLHVTACSLEAAGLGIRVGMPLGEARSLLPHNARTISRPELHSIANRPAMPVWIRANPVGDRVRLQTLALHCQRYSPLVGLEEVPQPESLWLDISGSEVLFGGEQELAAALQADLAQQGLRVRVAVADAWGAAWAASHFGEPAVSFVPPDQQANTLAPLPADALRISEKVIDSLRALDVSTIGRLMRLPRASLPSRFGKELVRRLDQALGLAPELLTAERLIEPIVAEWLFEDPVADRLALDHVCEVLLDRVLVSLNERRAALRELVCRWLGTTTAPISLRLLRPTTDRRHLLELLRLQCERCVFTSSVTGVRLEVLEIGQPPIRQSMLFEGDAPERHQPALAELVERLSSRLGRQAVLRPRLRPDPQPEYSCQCVPWLAGTANAYGVDSSSDRRIVRATNGPTSTLVPSRLRCRPLRLLRSPQPLVIQQSSPEGWPSRLEGSQVVRISDPERIETGWWRGPDAKRDYYRLDMADGAAWWVFCERDTGRWFLHGLFV